MAEITARRTGELLRTLFEILMGSNDGMPAREAMHKLAGRVTLSPYEQGEYESGGRRFDKIVRFATVDCVKAGWLQKEKGTWLVTDDGREAHQKITDPEVFYSTARKLYNQWKASQPDAQSPSSSTDPTIEEINDVGPKAVSITYEEAEEQAWTEIDRVFSKMSGYDFQDFIADLLTAMSYHVSWIAPPGKDGGLDIVAAPDVLGTRPPRIKVQAKNQGQSVNVDGLRSFLALLGEDDVGLYVCAAGFTKDAELLARSQEKRRVTLINQRRLFDLWVQHYDKLSDRARRRLPLKPIYFLAPEG